MLVEQAGDVGGIATSGMMSHWTGATRGGFYEEIIRRTSDSAELPAVINTEKLRTEMLRMLREENVELLLYTFACGVIMDIPPPPPPRQ